MFSRLWKCLILALCSTAGIACSHNTCSTCSTSAHARPIVAKSCSSCSGNVASAQPNAPEAVVTVVPGPRGQNRSFVIVGSQGCNTCQSSKGGQLALIPVPAASVHSNAAVPGASVDGSSKPHVTAKPDLSSDEHRDPATGSIRYDHARDYSWIVGQLEYLHLKHQWRVRYSPYDVDDELGGVVSLQGVDHLGDRLQNGMTVRVQGMLVNPENRKGSPEYHVFDLKSMQ